MIRNFFKSIVLNYKSSFSIKERTSRFSFSSFLLFLIIFIPLLIFVIESLILLLIPDTSPKYSGYLYIFAIYFYLLNLPALCSLCIRRLHDLNKSSLYICPLLLSVFLALFLKEESIYLNYIFALISIVYLLYLALAKGSEDTNLFGPKPFL